MAANVRIVQEGAAFLVQVDLTPEQAERYAYAYAAGSAEGAEIRQLAETARQMTLGEGEG